MSAQASEPSYVLVTAAFNEEMFVEQTIRSVVSQMVLPSVWVIVSDGSTDRTDEIVQQYATRYPFIRLLRRERGQHRGFASKVFALGAGVDSIALGVTEFIGHLDADVELPPEYFCDLLKEFDADPTLGIAGGWYFEKRGEQFRPARGSTTRSIPGGIQMFRRKCYEDIGGLLPIEYGGEDWYAEITARKCGWQVQSFPELEVRHLRPAGTKSSIVRYCYHQGFMDYSFGAHPLFEFAKVARRLFWRPFIVGAVARLLGFVVAHVRGQRLVPRDSVAFLRKEQLGRLFSKPFYPSGD